MTPPGEGGGEEGGVGGGTGRRHTKVKTLYQDFTK